MYRVCRDYAVDTRETVGRISPSILILILSIIFHIFIRKVLINPNFPEIKIGTLSEMRLSFWTDFGPGAGTHFT